MAVLQKNDGEQTPALETYFDGALSEQCNQYHECADFDAVPAAGKPVLNAEYKLASRPASAQRTPPAGIMGARFNLALNGRHASNPAGSCALSAVRNLPRHVT